MRRLGIVLVCGVLALGAAGVATATHGTTVYGYAGPGEWFSPGEAYGAYFDGCGRWIDNNFSKGEWNWGLITFITTTGSWRYTVQGNGSLTVEPPDTWSWRKKPHCRNNSRWTYQGGCWALHSHPYSCV